MEYLVRLAQVHETFRKPELEALATLADVQVDFVQYREDVCTLHGMITFSAKARPSHPSASSVCKTNTQPKL